MPGIARQFEPQITRSGGTPSKYRFSVRCSQCHKTDAYEASKPTNDDIVKGYFKERGWLLGRDRSYDLCSTCLAKPRNAEQSRRGASDITGRLSDRPVAPDKRYRDTADILARHLGKPEALAAEVFRPKEVQPARPSAIDTSRQPLQASALPPEMEQALIGMAADLKGLRSAMELMAEEVGKLVALGGQHIDAIACLAPLMVQSAEGISSSVRDVVSAVRSIPISPLLPAESLDDKEQPTSQPVQAHDQTLSAEAEPDVEGGAEEPVRQGPRSKRSGEKARRTVAAPVVVKSIPDAKRSDRYYTSIRLPRELWDSTGFGPEDRLLLDWSGKALTIERAAEGGVKPKSIGEAAVVLQSWKLGNLNFDKPKVTGADASLRLTARPLRSWGPGDRAVL
ncbi:hypothetical protein ACD578_28310 (plasmid) [Microvirga sp. RSM25]|uniref:hypothetical protein n=1 Tax=Microvirga sp. RSM25 TaxID=3273802 RepID=UPI00384CEFB3